MSTNRRDLSHVSSRADKKREKEVLGRVGCDEAFVWTTTGFRLNKDIFVFYLTLCFSVFLFYPHHNSKLRLWGQDDAW